MRNVLLFACALALAAGVGFAQDAASPPTLERGLELQRERKFDESVAVLGEAAEAARGAGDVQLAFRCFEAQSRSAWLDWEWGAVVEISDRWHALAKEHGDGAAAGRALVEKGGALARQKTYDAAAACLDEGLENLRAAEDEGGIAKALGRRGDLERRQGKLDEALATLREAAIIAERTGDVLRQGLLDREIGRCLENQGKRVEALSKYDRSIALLSDPVRPAELAESLGHRADALRALGRTEESRAEAERGIALSKELRNGSYAWLLTILGLLHGRNGDLDAAIAAQQQALEVWRELGQVGRAGWNLNNIAYLRSKRGEWDQALDGFEEAERVAKECGDDSLRALALSNVASVQMQRGTYASARETLLRALEFARERQAHDETALVLTSLGTTLSALGDYEVARLHLEAAAALGAEIGNVERESNAWRELACTLSLAGEVAPALDAAERSLETARRAAWKEGMVLARIHLGEALRKIGDLDAARAAFEKALEDAEHGPSQGVRALALHGAGYIAFYDDDADRAVELLRRAVQEYDAAGNVLNGVYARYWAGRAELARGGFDAARNVLREGCERAREKGLLTVLAQCVGGLAEVERAAGNVDAAHELHREAIETAESVGSDEVAGHNYTRLVEIHLERGDSDAAYDAALKALDFVDAVMRGLGDLQGAEGRESRAETFEHALRAAVATKDPGKLFATLERTRAGTLAEALGGQRALEAAALAPELREELQGARGAVAAANDRLRSAYPGGALKVIRSLRKEASAAADRLADVVTRIQRVEKRGAVFEPPVELAALQAGLAQGDVYVAYALFDDGSVALRVTKDDARIVPLAGRPVIEEACAALDLGDEGSDAAKTASALVELVVRPLGLTEADTRLLIAPDGALSYIPAGLLVGKRDVVLVPSATTFASLRSRDTGGGTHVLALGDPDYAAPRTGPVAKLRSGMDLARLPATRDEVKAVGNDVLLGREATETRLATLLATRPRWRAVHLACHGLVDTERPDRCALALTPGDGQDGFLSMIEIVRMDIPADLVSLSACQTARGRVYSAEGAVGLTRAFMVAGSPRVLASLWNVDDAATRALMERFYALWNPKEGKGLPAVTALRKAQDHVRSQERWKHPRYWAAWVLWGLP